MRARSPFAPLALLVALSLLAAGAVYAQQKQRLREVIAAGDVVAVESTFHLDVQVRVAGVPAEVPPRRFQTHARDKYTRSVLARSAKGTTAVRYAYAIARSIKTSPSGAQQVEVSSMQGKTVVVKRVGDKVIVSVTKGKGKLTPEDHDAFVSDLNNTNVDFYPAKEVGPGDGWTAPSDSLAYPLPTADELTVEARFEEVVRHAGHPCARVRTTVTAEGANEEYAGTITASLTGNVYLALDLQRTLAVDLSGPVTLKGEVKREDALVAFTGTGRMAVKESFSWLKVAGKPVAAKP